MKSVFLAGLRFVELIWGFPRRQAVKKGGDGQVSQPETEMARGDRSVDAKGVEVVEPRPEPDPSAREEFHQAYTKKLRAADRDVEDFARVLDFISYPVSSIIPFLDQRTLTRVCRLPRPCSLLA